MKNTIILAISGMRVWRRNIANLGNGLILVIPDYNTDILSALPQAVEDYVKIRRMKYNHIHIVYYDKRIQEYLTSRMKNINFIKLQKKDLEKLLCYFVLNMRHIGIPPKNSIKIISTKISYAGQLDKVREKKLFPMASLIREMIMMKE